MSVTLIFPAIIIFVKFLADMLPSPETDEVIDAFSRARYVYTLPRDVDHLFNSIFVLGNTTAT